LLQLHVRYKLAKQETREDEVFVLFNGECNLQQQISLANVFFEFWSAQKLACNGKNAVTKVGNY
jgi:hypothetical protein